MPGDERFEVKGEKSFYRKLFEEMWDRGSKKSPDAIKLKMNDTVRYTYVFPADRYTAGLYDVVDALAGKGYRLAGAKNFWFRSLTPRYDKFGNRLSDYPGINLTFWTKDGSNLFEVQIHTPESYKAKKSEEPHYEQRRANRAAIAAILNQAKRDNRDPEKGELTRAEQDAIDELEADDVHENEKSSEIFNKIDPPPGAIRIPELKLE